MHETRKQNHRLVSCLTILLLLFGLSFHASAENRSALGALGSLGSSLGLDQENEILPPEEAYRFSAEVSSPITLRLYWQIAGGTYLYQDKVKVDLVSGEGVSLGNYRLPPAETKKGALRPDGTIGDLQVFHDEIDLTIPLIRDNALETEIELRVRYQGCAEAGICYPPQTKKVNLRLPAMEGTPSPLERAEQAVAESQPAAMPQALTADQPPMSETDQITSTLAGGSIWVVIASFLGFGLLLALTPCVFPMIPILSGIIAGHGTSITTRKAFVLSLVYVLAMSVTYTLAGVLAGLFGKNLQAAFQDPWILGTFALVFVLLALSMFGFYDLQLPSRWQSKLTEASNRQKGGSLTGVAVMGFLSALIVGPCVAPPLAGALIYIGQTGDAVLGGLALFALAMGMGAPLILIGTSAGKLLPRAGAWMDRIKAVFGVGMLAVAIIMLERILPPAVAMVLWGALMVISAIYMGALHELPVEASGWDRFWKGLGVVILIYGGLMLVGAAAGGKDTVQPLRGIAAFSGANAESAHLEFRRIKTVDDLNREVAAASASGRAVMLDFYADWCVTCKEMERYTFSDPGVISALKGVTLLQADVTANDDNDQALLQGHFGMPGPPSIMFYGTDGKERKGYRVVGFMAADDFTNHIRQAIK
jgi:thiol:disulfide interchange protein DsbD